MVLWTTPFMIGITNVGLNSDVFDHTTNRLTHIIPQSTFVLGTGIEPVFSPWKGDGLTVSRTEQKTIKIGFKPTSRIVFFHTTKRHTLCDPAGRNRPSCDAYIGAYHTTLLDCCRELGIRTPEAFTLASFQDWCHQPLGQLSIFPHIEITCE